MSGASGVTPGHRGWRQTALRGGAAPTRPRGLGRRIRLTFTARETDHGRACASRTRRRAFPGPRSLIAKAARPA